MNILVRMQFSKVTFAPDYPIHSLCHAFAKSGRDGNTGCVGGSCTGGCDYFYYLHGNCSCGISPDVHTEKRES